MSGVAKPTKQAGFTIIELLIATAVFSVIILVVTAAVLQFSRQYYKGIIASSTQGAARTLVDDISRSIQFNGGTVNPIPDNINPTGLCVGTDKRYSYALNQQVTDAGSSLPNQGYHGLVSDDVTGCGTDTVPLDVKSLPAKLPTTLSNARELLGQHMRVSKFSVTGGNSTNNLYTISVRIVYGDNDLLCSQSAGDCNTPAPSSAAVLNTATDLSCRSTVGSQFCAVSELTTTVRKRVN